MARKTRRAAIVVVGTITLMVEAAGASGHLQRGAPSPPTADDTRPFTIAFPKDVVVGSCGVETFMMDGAGGRNRIGFAGAPRADGTYSFPTVSKGIVAQTLKAVVECKGYSVALLDVALGTAYDYRATIAPTKLVTVRLTGHITLPPNGQSLDGLEVAVFRSEFWRDCDYLFPPHGPNSAIDCLMFLPGEQSAVATTRSIADGAFAIDIPDFVHDPALPRVGLTFAVYDPPARMNTV